MAISSQQYKKGSVLPLVMLFVCLTQIVFWGVLGLHRTHLQRYVLLQEHNKMQVHHQMVTQFLQEACPPNYLEEQIEKAAASMRLSFFEEDKIEGQLFKRGPNDWLVFQIFVYSNNSWLEGMGPIMKEGKRGPYPERDRLLQDQRAYFEAQGFQWVKEERYYKRGEFTYAYLEPGTFSSNIGQSYLYQNQQNWVLDTENDKGTYRYSTYLDLPEKTYFIEICCNYYEQREGI